MNDTPKKRGFAGMDPEAARRVRSLGGTTAHRNGNAHRFTPEEARAAVARRQEIRRAKKAGTYQPGQA